MAFWGKVGCTVGIHDWSEFTYKSPASCEQIRVCQRIGCASVGSTTSHTWGSWLSLGSNRCLETMTCTRCGESEHRFNHIWSEWQYEAPQSCVQIRHCKRCADGSERQFPLHNAQHDVMPDDWKRVDCRNRSAYCRRCKYPLSMRAWVAEHRWGPMTVRNGRGEARCLDCGETGATD
jgi:hypothetical protein